MNQQGPVFECRFTTPAINMKISPSHEVSSLKPGSSLNTPAMLEKPKGNHPRCVPRWSPEG